jgi:uracil phosphoribosyltransferase
MNLTIVDHPLTRHYLTVLRKKETDPQQFRAAAKGLTYTLVFEATRQLPTVEFVVETPMGPTTGYRVENVVAVPVLRAGLGLLDAVLEMIPDVKVGFAGVARDEETAQPQEYYAKLPDLSKATVLICEPMLATGGSLSWAVDKVKSSGAKDITALCVVTAPEGVARMYEDHPDVQIIAAAHDQGLNEDFYIVPGLGDMGDRLFGTT